MTREELLNRLSQAESELRAIAHSHGLSPRVNERVLFAICLIRDAWVVVNEGQDAVVPDVDSQLHFVRRLMRQSLTEEIL